MRKSSLMFSLICGLGLFSTVNISVVVPGVFEVTCCSGTQYDAGEAFSGVRVELGIDDQLCGQALGLAYDGKYDVETVTRVAGPEERTPTNPCTGSKPSAEMAKSHSPRFRPMNMKRP